MRNRVPGYLGNTHYWFGNAGLGAFSRSRSRSRRKQTPQQIARDAERERKRQERDAQRAQQRAKQQAQKAQQQAQRDARRAPKKPSPNRARSGPPPLIMPKAKAMAPDVEEQMLMQELEQKDTTGAGPSPGMDSGGGGGGYTPPSGGKAAPTAEELLAEREVKAITVAEQLAAQYQGKPRPKMGPSPTLPQESSLPQESVFERKRPGIFGPILDALFGPPPA